MIDRGQWAQVCWSNIAYAEHTWRKKLAVALKLEIYWLPSITKLQLSETEGSDTCTRYIWFNELPTTALPRQSGNTKLSFISDLVRTKQWGGGYKKKSQEWDRFSLLSLSLSLSFSLFLPASGNRILTITFCVMARARMSRSSLFSRVLFAGVAWWWWWCSDTFFALFFLSSSVLNSIFVSSLGGSRRKRCFIVGLWHKSNASIIERLGEKEKD